MHGFERGGEAVAAVVGEELAQDVEERLEGARLGGKVEQVAFRRATHPGSGARRGRQRWRRRQGEEGVVDVGHGADIRREERAGAGRRRIRVAARDTQLLGGRAVAEIIQGRRATENAPCLPVDGRGGQIRIDAPARGSGGLGRCPVDARLAVEGKVRREEAGKPLGESVLLIIFLLIGAVHLEAGRIFRNYNGGRGRRGPVISSE